MFDSLVRRNNPIRCCRRVACWHFLVRTIVSSMWSTVLSEEHGQVCVDLGDSDPSVYAVRQSLQKLLNIEMCKYDLMLGTYCMEDEALLADFGLTDGYGHISMHPRSRSSASVGADCSDMPLGDAIEPVSLSMSEVDAIEWTQGEEKEKRVSKRKARSARKRRSQAGTSSSTSTDLVNFPTWQRKKA